ncbi:trimeric intracellular cation channel family protein [Sphingomonas piscis]|uniref:Trimeric intracellular cation channel family protein n=1 Tax=Sphingomonas piscis TaxID=2714943 RepID=A0A6G7YRK5_9SPHN|nr:trimeric intracellular cation channel family protein [Sphingomonas piscis]QIK79378.1 trimeric intracellular cation channel family protein [Sphingomonas piscis]
MVTPPLEPLLPAIAVLDYVGIAVFAISGALLAAEKKLTLVTFLFFAVVTGVGGGTVRDVLIGAPVFWMHENWILLICLAAGMLVWVTPRRWWGGGLALAWFDAVGLAVYSTYGAAKGLAFGAAPLPAFGMGVITACVGGILRDVLAGEPSILLRPELYVTAGALASGLMVLLTVLGVPEVPAGAIAALSGFALRAAAIARGWALPAYRR